MPAETMDHATTLFRREAEGGWITAGESADALALTLGGRWDIPAITALEAALSALEPSPSLRRARIDLGGLERLDTAGAWLIVRTARRLERRGLEVETVNASPSHGPLLETVGKDRPQMAIEEEAPNKLVAIAYQSGVATVEFCRAAVSLLSFFGMLVSRIGRTAVQPRRLRFTSFIYHMEMTGLNSIPIVCLLAFLIGVVLAYQGAEQLQRFGAELFTVNLLGVAILREIGVLITAIIVAGRSGSAFTAQIGTMKVNQEIDAMETLGLDPAEVLVVPRVLALTVTLPALAFLANIVALTGGAIMCYFVLDIGFGAFIRQLELAVSPSLLLVGLVKAPVFAVVIAMVGCYEGMKVGSSAQSVGAHTTKSVVESIFLVIVLDAIFSILFSILGL